MIEVLAYALIGLTAALAVFGLVTTVLGRPAGVAHARAAAVVESGLVVQLVIAAIRLLGGVRPAETQTFVIYLLVSVCLLPVGVQFARAEESRWGGAVIAVAAVAQLIVVFRLLQLWGGVGG